MSVIYLELLFVTVILRIMAGYDSRYQSGKYIQLKNRTLAALLLAKQSPFNKYVSRPNKDRNKMTVGGAILYIALFAVVILAAVLIFIPTIPTEPWEWMSNSKLQVFADTLNEKIFAVSVTELFLATLAYTVYLALWIETKKLSKRAVIIARTFAVIILALFAICGVYMIYSLISGI